MGVDGTCSVVAGRTREPRFSVPTEIRILATILINSRYCFWLLVFFLCLCVVMIDFGIVSPDGIKIGVKLKSPLVHTPKHAFHGRLLSYPKPARA